jgi:heat-inducible transcriptional repressor
MQETLKELNDRQRAILRCVVDHFIVTATPVASSHIAKHHDLGISTATIRNTMADLEDLGFVMHPHTSAGKMPTDKGYRFFVDSLMTFEPLTQGEQGTVKLHLETVTEIDELLHQTAKLLGSISHQLSIVSAPHLTGGIFERMELISVTANRIFIVLTIKSGIVKTITVEVETEIPREKLEHITRLLNERLGGLTLETIRETFAERVHDFKNEQTGLINLFIRSADKIFDDIKERDKLHISGTQSLVEQPEYENPDNVRNIIELINDEDMIVNVLEQQEKQAKEEGVAISIGEEHGEEKLKNHSIVVSTYRLGDVVGTIAIIGPKRMKYSKAVPLLNFVSEHISSTLNKES